ncbi:MAG: hypothetical protein K6F10_00660 [Paludibacteraceae bacterium]|nr:hypothetical protein [Paludibacteraceae bacterium]
MSSCSQSLEKKIEKYEKEGKTILSSTIGLEVKHPCIVFSDDKGVYVDNLKEVYQSIDFNKEYTIVISSLSIPSDKPEIKIDVEEIPMKHTFSTEELESYEIYPIGDWATFLRGKNDWGSDIPNYILQKGSNTLYSVSLDNVFWNSRYHLQYATGEEEDAALPAAVGEEGEMEEEEYITIPLFGEYKQFQNGYANLAIYFENCDQKFFSWLKSEYEYRQTLFSANLTITKDHFFDASTIKTVTFFGTTFQTSEIGSNAMYAEVAKLIYNDYVAEKQKEAEEEQQERVQNILDQCTSLAQIRQDISRNKIQAEQKYSGKKILLDVTLSTIRRVDTRYASNQYCLEHNYVGAELSEYLDLYIYTDDESFIQLDYPHRCVVAGILDVSSSSYNTFRVEDCELVLY